MSRRPQHQRIVITTPERKHFIEQELSGYANAFATGDLRAVAICQFWSDAECMNAWHIESEEERVAIVAKLKEMIRILES